MTMPDDLTDPIGTRRKLEAKNKALREALEMALETIKSVEFSAVFGAKCPSCFGWNMISWGETAKVHTKDCQLSAAITAATKALGVGGDEYDWHCTNCKTEFKDSKPDREPGSDGGANCPRCKAFGQYTYRKNTPTVNDAVWQPIETAPKDGRWVLVTWIGHPSRCEAMRYDEGGDWQWWEGDTATNPPTHWMPLPAAPKALQSEPGRE